MVDEPITEEDARRRFAAYLAEVDARDPAPDCEAQLAAIFAEHEAECDRLAREQSEAETEHVAVSLCHAVAVTRRPKDARLFDGLR